MSFFSLRSPLFRPSAIKVEPEQIDPRAVGTSLSENIVQALEGASTPSQSNPFLTATGLNALPGWVMLGFLGDGSSGTMINYEQNVEKAGFNIPNLSKSATGHFRLLGVSGESIFARAYASFIPHSTGTAISVEYSKISDTELEIKFRDSLSNSLIDPNSFVGIVHVWKP